MKQIINIRGNQDKPKVGNYQALRNDINQKRIKREEAKKKSVNSATDPSKIVTTKPLDDQR